MKPAHIALAVLIAAVWGFNFIAIKLGVAAVPPFFFTAARFALAAFPAILFVPRPTESWRWVAAFGLVLGVGQFGFLFLAVRLGLPAGLTSVVVQLQAPFTMLFAWFVLAELPQTRQLWGAAIAFVGMGVIAIPRWAGSDALPLLLSIIAAAGWAAANIITKKAKPQNTLSFVIWSCLWVPIPMLLLSWIFEDHAQIIHAIMLPTPQVVISLIYIAFLSTVFGYGAWNYLIRLYPASTVAPFSLLVPLFGVAGGVLAFGERFDSYEITGGALIIAGLIFSNFGPQRIGLKKKADPEGSAT